MTSCKHGMEMDEKSDERDDGIPDAEVLDDREDTEEGCEGV